MKIQKTKLKCTALAVAAMVTCRADAFGIDTGISELQLRWDTTFKYSAAWRLKDPSQVLTSAQNLDDGDRNFDKGLISNRLDVLTEVDVSYHGFGARVSGAAWYDDVYNRRNANDSPASANSTSVPYNEFTNATRNLHGRKGELLDAFVFGKVDVGDTTATFRLGRHTVLWGESFFFGANGIAAGQAPIDIVKAQSVPNTQFKELIRPTEQISGQWQLTPDLTFGAYYQWRWEKNRFAAAGSYFSASDAYDDGGERLLYFGPYAAPRIADMKAKNSGQMGAQVRWRADETDYGLYATRYHDKSPQTYLYNLIPVVGLPAQLQWVYPEGISAFGASFSHTIGIANVAGEVSLRHNMPLSSNGQLDMFGIVPAAFGGPSAPADNAGNALYAVGKTAHAQVSWLASLNPNFLAREASFLGEVAWNRTLSVTRNPGALNPNADRDAVNVRMVYEPMYRQALPGVDLSVPLGLGFGIGNSSALGSAFMGNKTGDISFGVSAVYLDTWRLGLNVTHYFGPEGTFLDAANQVSFKQSLKDRDFVSMSIRRTF